MELTRLMRMRRREEAINDPDTVIRANKMIRQLNNIGEMRDLKGWIIEDIENLFEGD